MDIFSIRLETLIKERRITKYRLAKDLKCSKQSVINWCEGITEPNIKYIRQLATYFDVTTDYLLGMESYDGQRVTTVKNNFTNFNE